MESGMETTAEDAEILSRVIAGDKESFRLVLERYQGPVFACACAVLGSREDAADVTQETFVRFYNNMEQFDQRRPLKPYIMRISVNLCRDLLRTRRNEKAMVSAGAEDAIERIPDTADTPYEAMSRNDRKIFAGRALAMLPDNFRVVCSLFYLAGRSCGEVAEILGTSEGSVKVTLHRARKMLYEKLNPLKEAGGTA